MERDSWEWVILLAVVGLSYFFKRFAKQDPFEGKLPDETSESVKQLRRDLAEKIASRRGIAGRGKPQSLSGGEGCNYPATAIPTATADHIGQPDYFEAFSKAQMELQQSAKALERVKQGNAFSQQKRLSIVNAHLSRGQLAHNNLRAGIIWAEIIAPPLALRKKPYGGHGSMLL